MGRTSQRALLIALTDANAGEVEGAKGTLTGIRGVFPSTQLHIKSRNMLHAGTQGCIRLIRWCLQVILLHSNQS